MKECLSCRQVLDRSAFPIFAQSADGLFPVCRQCHSAATLAGRKRYEESLSGWSLSAMYRALCWQAHGYPEESMCYLCGNPNDESAWVDHLTPQSKADTFRHGDIHAPFNLRWAHATCNMSKGDRGVTAEQFKRLIAPDRLAGVRR